MTQKQILGTIVSVVVVVLVFVLIYRQFTGGGNGVASTLLNAPSSQKETAGSDNQTEIDMVTKAPATSAINDIVDSVETESSMDLSLLDAEEADYLEEVNQDSNNINNINAFYDENNL